MKLDDCNQFLVGRQTVTYINNSPDTLRRIYFLLYPNAYRSKETNYAREQIRQGEKTFYFSSPSQRGKIDVCQVKVDSVPGEMRLIPDSMDIGYVELPAGLVPGDSVRIAMRWVVKIPKIFSRFGHQNNHYECVQWYPKIPVYDHQGWHLYPYLDPGEFYYEFGDYDVKIELPAQYIVGATGELLAPLSAKKRLDSLAHIGRLLTKLPRRDIRKFAKNYRKKLRYPAGDTVTWRFHAKNVIDFAWVADPHYCVQKDTFRIDSEHSVEIWNLFLPENAAQWEQALEHARKVLIFYSQYLGPYPHPSVWLVDSKIPIAGGMEYPMLTTISPLKNELLMESVIAHEIGHNWFYGILGFDERCYPWLDEGLNTYFELRYVEENIPKERQRIFAAPVPGAFTDLNYLNYYRSGLAMVSRKNQDRPSNLRAEQYSPYDLFASVYAKPLLGLILLEEHVGRNRLDSAFSVFYRNWQYNHPYPIDLRESLENVLEIDLGWFFEDYIGTSDKPDFAIDKMSPRKLADGWSTQIKVRNSGRLSVPVPVVLYDREVPLARRSILATTESSTLNFETPIRPTHAVIDPEFISMDRDYRNNTTRYVLTLTPLGNLDRPTEFQIFYLPYLNIDYTNGFQLGAFLYRGNLVPIRHNFYIRPIYGFKSRRLLWYGGYSNTLYDCITRELKYSLFASSTTSKNMIRTGLELIHYPKFRMSYEHRIKLNAEIIALRPGTSLDSLVWSPGEYANLIVYHSYRKQGFLSDYYLSTKIKIGYNTLESISNSLYSRISQEVEFTHQIRPHQSISIRWFFGYIFSAELDRLPRQERFYASGGVDPSFTDWFMYDRSGQTCLSPMQNYLYNDGINLKGYQYVSGVKSALGMNLKYRIGPLFLYTDIGDVLNFDKSIRWLADAGIGLQIGPVLLYQTLFLNHPEMSDGYKKISDLHSLQYRWFLRIDWRSLNIL